jgi:hypothetical protein
MKVKIKKDRHTGETHIEYYNIADKASYRFDTLKNIINGRPDITIMVDTNQHTYNLPVDEVERVLEQSNIEYAKMPTETNKTSFFGLSIDLRFKNKKKTKEYLIILHISSEHFTRELFDSFLNHYDFAVGIGSKKPFDETCENLRADASEVLFNPSYFEESIYDSVLCTCLRCSFDIDKYPNK